MLEYLPKKIAELDKNITLLIYDAWFGCRLVFPRCGVVISVVDFRNTNLNNCEDIRSICGKNSIILQALKSECSTANEKDCE